MGTSSTQAVLLCMTKLPYAGYTILTPLRDRHDARDTRQRAGGRVYGKVRVACTPAGCPLSVVRHRHACAHRADADARATFWEESSLARSLAREFGGGGALTQT